MSGTTAASAPRPPRARSGAEAPGTVAGVRSALAGNLGRLRLARGLSLRELSATTGVSKALLSQIERAEANPTVEVLVRIAEALDTSSAELLRRPLPRPEIVRAAELAVPDDEISVHLLFSSHEHGRTELYRTTLPPRSRSQASTHGTGSVEYVMVVSGHVTLVADETPYPLAPGDAARFSGAVEHYYTTGAERAVTHSMLGYPRA
ncbi:XRE family transcriptional regulator [Streptomyces sp. NPDC047046]|uniref:helix-turn-helix domain-containing protein n=1 Tax=Streptomyces sp. NPDC047046 TaxID=3155378 RepID=UPI0033FAA1DD